MTTPQQSAAYDPQAASDSLDRLARITTGNKHLISEPGLVQALMQNNATPQQAQALNQFMGGLKAEMAVRVASRDGQKIRLDDSQQAALRAMGIPFDSVLETDQTADQRITEQMAAVGRQPVRDANGQIQTDATGNPLTEPVSKPKKHKGLGRLLNTLNNDLIQPIYRDAIKPTFSVASKPFYWMQYGLSTFFDTHTIYDNPSEVQKEEMRVAGYDPESFFSRQAYIFSGRAHHDTSDLAEKYGQDQVTDALRFADNPEKYRQAIYDDPANFTPDGKEMTPEGKAKLDRLNSPEFEEMVGRINGRRATIGTDFARGVGLKPQSKPFMALSASTDILASFFMDPVYIGLNAANKWRRTATAIDGLADSEGIRRVLATAENMPRHGARGRAARYVNDMVEGGKEFRAAVAAGDTVKATKIQARLDASNPLAGLLEDFNGTIQVDRTMTKAEQIAAGVREHRDLPFIYTNGGKPLETYDDAVEYFASKSALLRLTGGRAPVETTYMPGALSSYGYKKLRGSMASWHAGRSLSTTLGKEQKFLNWAAADPGRAQALIDEGTVTRFLPQADDAVDFATGRVVSAPVKGGLPSANRGEEARLALTPAGQGVVRRNTLDFGTAVAPSTVLGKAVAYGTAGVAARAKLAAARLGNWIPRETEINLLDAASGDVIKKGALTYLTKGDANMVAARWSLADGAERKAMVQALEEQLYHSAGLTRTKAGQAFIQRRQTEFEHYMTDGKAAVDARGREMAMYPGQVQEHFKLPSFGALHAASSKVGLYETTISRILSTWQFNALLQSWKIPVLASPVTANRAITESWLASYADRQFVGGLQAKVALRDTGRLSAQEVHRTKLADKVANLPVLQQTGRFYRHVIGKKTPQELRLELDNIPEDILARNVHEQSALHYALNVDPANINERTEAAMLGLRARKVVYDTREGYDDALRNRLGYEVTDVVDGMRGVNPYAHNLAIRVNNSPDVAKAMLNVIQKRKGASVDDVVRAMDDPSIQRLVSHSGFGKVFWDERGVQQDVVTAADATLGKRQWAERITDEFGSMITGRNGVLNKKIATYIRRTGKAPDADWLLDNAKFWNAPDKMLSPVFQAVPKGDGSVKEFVEGNLLDPTGRLYQWLVERPIQRHVTSPFFAHAYAKSKLALNRTYKQQLIKGGLPEDAAEMAAQNVAAMQGWTRIARMVDDPQMRSQLDIAGRGFFAFSRATTMMLRRWGDIAWRNPEQARRLMLAIEGSTHSGLVYKDENGQWNFHVPLSGVGQEVILHAASTIPGLEGLAMVPVSDFQGRVTSIIPGSDNPLQYTTTPMVSISGRKLAMLFPEHREIFDTIDRKLNGTAGQGKGVMDTLTPGIVRRFFQAIGEDGRNSVLSSAMIGSLFNLYAAGDVPNENASPSEVDDWFQKLKTGTKSQLFLRALVGMYSPASIAVPENETAGSKPDFSYAYQGAQGLRDEFKRILKDVDGDFARATAVWTALHPDKTVYTSSASHATLNKAQLPATQAALDWIRSNDNFIKKYKSVAGYFIPPQKAGEPYSQAAYRAELEMGLRERKTPREFYEQVRISTDADEFYTMKKAFDADIAKAEKEGNDAYAKARRDQWQQQSDEYKTTHPLFGRDLIAGSAQRISEAMGQLADLRRMVAAGDVPQGLSAAALSSMIQAYDGYKQYRKAHDGQSNYDRILRSHALAQLQDHMDKVIAVAPEMTSIYRAVFRTLNSQLAQLDIIQ